MPVARPVAVQIQAQDALDLHDTRPSPRINLEALAQTGRGL
jgi:hypothetical protein